MEIITSCSISSQDSCTWIHLSDSFDPAAGSPSGSEAADSVLVGSPVVNGDGTETVTYRDTIAFTAASKRFMRLEVKLAASP